MFVCVCLCLCLCLSLSLTLSGCMAVLPNAVGSELECSVCLVWLAAWRSPSRWSPTQGGWLHWPLHSHIQATPLLQLFTPPPHPHTHTHRHTNTLSTFLSLSPGQAEFPSGSKLLKCTGFSLGPSGWGKQTGLSLHNLIVRHQGFLATQEITFSLALM